MVAEKAREPEEGEAPKSPSKIVADSLSQISRSSTFLPNIGVTKVQSAAQSTIAAVKPACKLNFRQHSKQKERMLQGSRKSCRNSFEFSRPLLKNTKVCCARPKKR